MSLDLAGLDPVTAQFDLIVDAAEALDRSIGSNHSLIARSIESAAWPAGIVYEPGCRQLILIEIA